MVLESVRAGPVAAAKPNTSCRVRVCGAEVVQVRGEDAQRPDADPLLHEDEDGATGAQSAFPFGRLATPDTGVSGADAGEAGAGHAAVRLPEPSYDPVAERLPREAGGIHELPAQGTGMVHRALKSAMAQRRLLRPAPKTGSGARVPARLLHATGLPGLWAACRQADGPGGDPAARPRP